MIKIKSPNRPAYELSSIRVQKGSEVALTTVVNGMSEQPKRGIEWRSQGKSCTARKCQIKGADVSDEL